MEKSLLILFAGFVFMTGCVSERKADTKGVPPAAAQKHQAALAHIDTVTLTVSIRPFASADPDSGGGLRSVLLYSGMSRIEPVGQWPDGTPASGSARIPLESMRQLLNAFQKGGLLKRAEIYYSERTKEPKGDPPAKSNITTKFAEGWARRSAEIRVNFFADNYYTYYLIPIGWGDQLVSVLRQMHDIVDDPSARSLLKQLQDAHNRFDAAE